MESRRSISVIYFGDSHGFVTGEKNGFGGFAKIATAVKHFRNTHPETLFLYGGDLLGPAAYSREYKGEVDAVLLGAMYCDAFAIGNHDLHRGPTGLRHIIDWTGAGTQFLAANIDLAKEPELAGKIHPSVIFEKAEQRIAVIGALTEEAKMSPKNQLGKIEFHPLITSLKKQIRAAKKQGADVIILLSHLGYQKDQEIAPVLLEEGHDLVILGNHTHTVLGNLPAEEFGASKGTYPTEVSAHDRKAFISAAAHNGKAVGTLHLEYTKNNAGDLIITQCTGEPLVIDASIPNDPDIEKIIARYPLKEEAKNNDVIAHTEVDLIGLESFGDGNLKELEDIIRREETPLTNLVADSVLSFARKHTQTVDFALIHAGGVRSDIRSGGITKEQINRLLPFPHFIRVMKLTGRQIMQALEEGVYTENYHRRGNFLIGSAGFTYTYDVEKSRDERISKITFNGEPLAEDGTYTVAVNSYMLGMKVTDELASIFARAEDQMIAKIEQTDCTAVLDYCEQHDLHISGKLEGRIHCAQGSLLHRYAVDASPEDLYNVAIANLKTPPAPKETAGSISIPATLYYNKPASKQTDTPQPNSPRLKGI